MHAGRRSYATTPRLVHPLSSRRRAHRRSRPRRKKWRLPKLRTPDLCEVRCGGVGVLGWVLDLPPWGSGWRMLAVLWLVSARRGRADWGARFVSRVGPAHLPLSCTPEGRAGLLL